MELLQREVQLFVKDRLDVGTGGREWTVENTSVLVESGEIARVVGEDVSVGVVGEVLGKLHEAFRVVEHAAREGQGASRHRGEAVAVV